MKVEFEEIPWVMTPEQVSAVQDEWEFMARTQIEPIRQHHWVEAAVRLGIVVPASRIESKAQDIREDSHTLRLEHNGSNGATYGASVMLGVAKEFVNLIPKAGSK